MTGLSNPIAEAIERAARDLRTRSSWNERLQHWERPASDSEEEQIERAARMVRAALGESRMLSDNGMTIAPQGSYHNNTNVRLESDMDLRAVHPWIRTECAPGVDDAIARAALGVVTMSGTFQEKLASMRGEIAAELRRKFTSAGVDDTGNKAIRIKKRPGTRADVDVVPCFRYWWIWQDTRTGLYEYAEGITILCMDGKWASSYPEQHHANGIAKRERTAHRFKKNARSLKRLRDELVNLGAIGEKQVPSFLIECLAYAVEDSYYLIENDDRYDRLLRILRRLTELLADQRWTSNATEINGIKYLFHPAQPWTLEDAMAFVLTALARLET